MGSVRIGTPTLKTEQSGAPSEDLIAADLVKQAFSLAKVELARVIVGLDNVIEQLFIAMLCGGHCVLEGSPGLAKTKLVSTIASLLDLSFQRIQFTPDLMPGDITGSDIFEQDHATGKYDFRFRKGPLFANVILADEINRTPPKTQSALLEAMEERQISVGGNCYKLPKPFFVLATQNPIEHEGTYSLPEAQLDRFFMKVLLEYPSAEDEQEIVRRACEPPIGNFQKIIDSTKLIAMQQTVLRVPTGDQVIEFASKLVRATRPCNGDPRIVKTLTWGAGPRATICLVKAAKARALLQGRYHATTDDVVAVAKPVLRHRLLPNYAAEASGVGSDRIVEYLLGTIKR